MPIIDNMPINRLCIPPRHINNYEGIEFHIGIIIFSKSYQTNGMDEIRNRASFLTGPIRIVKPAKMPERSDGIEVKQGWKTEVGMVYVKFLIIAIYISISWYSGNAFAETAEDLFEHAMKLERTGKTSEAVEMLTRAGGLDPKNPAIFNNRGIILARKNEIDPAIDDFTKALQLNPDDAVIFNNRGLAYRQKGDSERAMEDFNKALALDANYVEALFNRGNLLFQAGQVNDATWDLQNVLKMDGRHNRARILLGKIYLSSGAPDKALSEFSAAIKQHPQNVEALEGRGNANFLKARFKEAIKDYTEVLRLGKDSSQVRSNLCAAGIRVRDFSAAAQHCEEAIRQDPKSAEAHFNSASAYAALERDSDALEQLNAAIELAKYTDYFYNRSIILNKLGKTEAALEDLRTVLDMDTKNADALNNMGVILVAKGNISEGMASLENALALQPDNLQTIMNIASARLKLKSPEKAIEILEPALKSYSKNMDLLILLGDACTAADRLDKSQALYRRVIDRSASVEHKLAASVGLAETLEKAGSPAKAVQAYSKSLDYAGDRKVRDGIQHKIDLLKAQGAAKE